MFGIYKKGQGMAARWVAVCGLGALAAFGCYEIYDYLVGQDWGTGGFSIGIGAVNYRTLVSAAVFLLAMILTGWMVNIPRFADYLILSEVELRKVSWPTRDELKRQTIVVIITLLLFTVILLLADLMFAKGSALLYGIKSSRI